MNLSVMEIILALQEDYQEISSHDMFKDNRIIWSGRVPLACGGSASVICVCENRLEYVYFSVQPKRNTPSLYQFKIFLKGCAGIKDNSVRLWKDSIMIPMSLLGRDQDWLSIDKAFRDKLLQTLSSYEEAPYPKSQSVGFSVGTKLV